MATSVRYSGRDVACVLRAACLLAIVRAVLRIRPGLLLRRSPRIARARRAAASPEQVVRSVRIAARLVGGRCLARALVSRTLLARAGVPVTLVMGTGEAGSAIPFRAHAWVEHHGKPVVPGEPVPAFPVEWRIAPHAVR